MTSGVPVGSALASLIQPRERGRTTPGRMLIEFGWPWPTMMLNGTWTKAIWRSGPVSAGSDLQNSALSERFCLPGGTGCGDSWMTPVRTWLWKFLPDAGQVDDGSMPSRLELLRVADAGEQQQLRRLDRAAADDDLAAERVRPVRPAVLDVLDARAAAVLDEQARGERVGLKVRFGRPSAGSR